MGGGKKGRDWEAIRYKQCQGNGALERGVYALGGGKRVERLGGNSGCLPIGPTATQTLPCSAGRCRKGWWEVGLRGGGGGDQHVQSIHLSNSQ